MVVAQIGVRKDEIPQRLRIPKARAMADHQPGMGAQDGDMVGRRLCVRGADADVHQGDPLPVRPLEMIGRHLR